jgi:hypothetical protein
MTWGKTHSVHGGLGYRRYTRLSEGAGCSGANCLGESSAHYAVNPLTVLLRVLGMRAAKRMKTLSYAWGVKFFKHWPIGA